MPLKPFTLTGPCAIQAADDKEPGKLPTFSGNAYTGAPMKPEGWGVPLIVDLDGVKIPNQHRPALRQHDHEQIVGHTNEVKADKTGIQVAGTFSGQPEHVEKVTHPAKNGFQWQLSIGANPIRTEFLDAGKETEVNGRKITGPMTISRETELGEISFVPLGADGDTSVSVSASRGGSKMSMKIKAKIKSMRHVSVEAARYADDEIEKMSDDDARKAFKKCMAEDEEEIKKKVDADDDAAAAAAAAADDKEEDKKTAAAAQRRIEATRKAEAGEIARCDEIRARVSAHGITEPVEIVLDGKKEKVNLVRKAIEAGWTPDQTELHALRAARPGAHVGGPHLHFGTDPILTGAVLECAVFDALSNQFRLFDSDFYKLGEGGQRRCPVREEKRIMAELNARYPDQVRQAAHTHFKGRIGLQQLLTTLAAANGYKGPPTFNDPEGWGDVAGYLAHPITAAPSSVNTPATLANVQNKFMLQGYMFTEQAYLEFCGILPVKDLKPTKSVQLFGDFQFKPLNPGGEIHHATVGDNPYANQATIQARMITLELQYLINDDLGMFGQVPMMLGRGWGLRVNDLVYAKLLSPGFDDGGSTNFFAATHTITGQSANPNYQSGATTALTSAGLQAAKILLDRQVDPAGKKLGIDAEVLLYPPELDVAAIELMNAQFIVMAGLASTSAASKQPNTNIWKGRFKPVMSRYLSDSTYTGFSTTGWYLLANPSVIPVIQIAALNGQMTPTVQTASQDWQFNQLGISSRGWGGVGVAMQNFRGGVLSAGV